MARIIQMKAIISGTKKKKGLPNANLKRELLSRGYYVHGVGRGGPEDIDYLIVSCNPPKNQVMPSSSN